MDDRRLEGAMSGTERRFLGSGAAGLLLAFALGACALLPSSSNDDVQRELNQKRRLWDAQGIDDYRFVSRRLCYCGGEITAEVVVEVRDGQIVSSTYQESEQPVSLTYAGLWPSLDGVFDIVQDAVDRDAHRIVVEYHPEHGFPTSIQIDYQEFTIDEELTFVTREFEAVP